MKMFVNTNLCSPEATVIFIVEMVMMFGQDKFGWATVFILYTNVMMWVNILFFSKCLKRIKKRQKMELGELGLKRSSGNTIGNLVSVAKVLSPIFKTNQIMDELELQKEFLITKNDEIDESNSPKKNIFSFGTHEPIKVDDKELLDLEDLKQIKEKTILNPI